MAPNMPHGFANDNEFSFHGSEKKVVSRELFEPGVPYECLNISMALSISSTKNLQRLDDIDSLPEDYVLEGRVYAFASYQIHVFNA